MEGLWLSVALVCFLLDLMTLNLYTVCASLGAVFAWATVRSGLPAWASAVVFLLITLAFIALLRPALVNWLLPTRDPYRQNSYETEGYVRKDE